MSESYNEKHLIRKVRGGNIYAFEQLFKTYYKKLCLFAEYYVREKSMAEEIVGNFFLKLWEKRKSIEIRETVKSYFYKSVHNQCLKYLEHLKVMKKYEEYARTILENKELFSPSSANYPLANLISREIEDEIESAINSLPDKCREIFCLCRFDNLTYEEVSVKLNVSINTIRTQMSRALEKLRESLKDYLPPMILLIISNLFLFLT